MKHLIILFVLLLATSAQADTYCKWTGTAPDNCIATRTIADGSKRAQIAGAWRVITTESAAEYGYYLFISIVPSIPDPATQKATSFTDAFDGTTITRTYILETKTVTEQNETAAEAMSVELYYILKWIKTPGTIKCDSNNFSLCHIDPTTAPDGIKAAYLARQALGQ